MPPFAFGVCGGAQIPVCHTQGNPYNRACTSAICPTFPGQRQMSDAIVLIPARLASTRLPGKPLADIHGAPMIVHVMRRAGEAGTGGVVVAPDPEAVAAAVDKAGGRAIMTRSDHASGSDRIFEALE